MMHQDKPEDYVVATGESRTVRDLVQYVFAKLHLNYEDYIAQDERFLRPEELNTLKGDSSPIRANLGWKPEYSFEQMIDEMISCNEESAYLK
jgi:GDPmannose 4,6-dehydratase